MKRAAFTLLEVLAALFVFAIVALIALHGLRGGAETTDLALVQAELHDEARSAAGLVAATAGEAAFVYPPGATLAFGSGWTTRNFLRGGSRWEVGRDAILAFVQAPRETAPDVPCEPAQNAPPERQAACAVFVAYYPVPRAEVVRRAVGAGHPGEDRHNGGAWVLFEYRRTLPFKSFVPFGRAGTRPGEGFGNLEGTVPTSAAELGGASGNIVMDFVAPAGFEVAFSACRGADGRSAVETCARTVAPTFLASAVRGAVRLQAEKRRAGGVTRPAPVEVGFAPRNLYAP